MAFIPMKSGGGTMSETVLWTNSSPTSSFSGQTITLSDDIDNYSYIKVEWRISTSNSNSNSFFMSVNGFKNASYTTGKAFPYMGGMVSTNTLYARRIGYASDTSINFGSAAIPGAANLSNDYMIPTNIYGVK